MSDTTTIDQVPTSFGVFKPVGWLMVTADDIEHAAAAAEIARSHGATLAVHYRMLTIEAPI